MQAIILAAGLGSRLCNLTEDKPKALVRVCNRELISWAISFLAGGEIESITVVTGYRGNLLKEFLGSNHPAVRTIQNDRFKDGSIFTIKKGLECVDGDFLLMNVDHIYPKGLLAKMMSNKRGITAVCDFDRQLVADDMKIKLDPSGKIQAIRKTLTDFNGGYIGMTMVEKDSIETYRHGVEEALRREGDATSVEMALGAIALNGNPINVCDASGIRWYEVDDQSDLAKAEEMIKNDPAFIS